MDPYIESLSQEVAVVLRELMNDLGNELKVMYDLNSNLKADFCTSVLSRVKDLCDDIREEVITKKNTMIKEIEDCLAEKSQLQKELRVAVDVRNQDNGPLCTSVERLNADLEKFRQIKKDRISEWESLSLKELPLCNRLGESRMPVKSPVPSTEELYDFKQHIHQLLMTKIDRERVMKLSRGRIMDMMGRLEVIPTDAFELEICNDFENMPLTTETLRKTEDVVNLYENRVKEAQDRVNELEWRLERLWNQINYPKHKQDGFKETYNGIGSSAVTILSREIERCEVYKRENMRTVILSIRQNIEHLWDKLTYTQEQRMAFSSFSSETWDDDTLELHETELTRLQNYYSEYEKIFLLAQKKDNLSKKISELDASAKDPNRYKNRGGQLLREEKERKVTEMSLSKTIAQLKEALLEYRRRTGQPFLQYGQDLLATLEENKKPNLTPHANQVKRPLPHLEMTVNSVDAESSPSKRARIEEEAVPTPKTPLRPANTRIPQLRRL